MTYIIYGTGGHARVLQDLIGKLGDGYSVYCFFDDRDQVDSIDGIPVLPYDAKWTKKAKVVLGIGSGRARKAIAAKVTHAFGTLIHPTATIADDVEIGEGTVILAGAVIQSGARIGKHTLINANVTVDHDAIVGDYVSIYPGVYIGGETHIAEGSLINPNAVIMRFSETEPFQEIKPMEVLIAEKEAAWM